MGSWIRKLTGLGNSHSPLTLETLLDVCFRELPGLGTPMNPWLWELSSLSKLAQSSGAVLTVLCWSLTVLGGAEKGLPEPCNLTVCLYLPDVLGWGFSTQSYTMSCHY